MNDKDPGKPVVSPAVAAAGGQEHARLAAGLFDELIAQPLPTQQAAWTGAAGTDAGASADWLNDAAAPERASARADTAALIARIGESVGAYRLVALLGRGGMGAVYAAERDDGEFVQRVALKLIRPGANAEHLAVRFRRERTILARLEHPHIARLLDGGVSQAGEPWFAMELVEGQALGVHCAQQALPLNSRLQLFLQICDAVAYAHRNLIVHRDLKPSNIMVTAQGEAKLLDFGIAKLLDEASSNGDETQADERILTPDYAAPEQVLGRPVTTATDVYALGLVLFEMLTGQQAQHLAGKSLLEAERSIAEQEPRRPSAALTAQGTSGATSATTALAMPTTTLARAVRGDLDAIVLKALRKEPERRYTSAQEFAEDIRRHLDGRPVLAVGDATSYRVAKFVRRHRIGIGAAMAVLLALIVGLGSALWQAREARLQADQARQVTNFVLGLFRSIDPELARGREITARELLDSGAKRLATELATQPAVQADLLDALGEMYTELDRGAEAIALLEQSLGLRRQTAQPGDPAPISTLIRLAEARLLAGRYTEARGLLQEAELLLARTGREHDQDRARVKKTLVTVHNRTGDFAAAERIAREWVELEAQHFGRDSQEFAIALGNLGWSLSWQGRYPEARQVLQEALRLARASGRDIDNGILRTLGTFGLVNLYMGRYQEAREQLEQMAAGAQALYGPEHAFAIQASGFVARARLMLGEVSAAETELRRVVALLDLPRYRGSPWLTFQRWNLAIVLAAQGKLAEAALLSADVLQEVRKSSGRGAKITMLATRDLGAIRVAQGQLDNGMALLTEALQAFRALEGEDGVNYADVEWRMAIVHLARGNPPSAEQAARHALSVSIATLGPAHDQTAAAANVLGKALAAQGQTTEAIAHLRRAVEILTELFGSNDLRTAVMTYDLGLALLANQEPGAKELLRAAAQTIVGAPGNELSVRTEAAAWLAKAR